MWCLEKHIEFLRKMPFLTGWRKSWSMCVCLLFLEPRQISENSETCGMGKDLLLVIHLGSPSATNGIRTFNYIQWHRVCLGCSLGFGHSAYESLKLRFQAASPLNCGQKETPSPIDSHRSLTSGSCSVDPLAARATPHPFLLPYHTI